MNLVSPASGASLSDCIRFAKKIGVEVFNPRGKSELIFRVPGMPSIRVHLTRKDAGRALTVFLRKVATLQEATV